MYQKLIIIGRLGRDPEMRFTPTGQAVTSFSVATDRSYTDQAGKPVKETVWFKVSAWGKLAETCNTYLQKGKLVLVEGRLTADKSGGPRVWTGQDGTPRATFEINANTVKFLSTKSEGSGGAAGVEEDMEQAPAEDIPF